MRGPKPEPTLPGNPRQLTINQHVHSRWCIDKFADTDERVGVLRRDQAPFNAKSDNKIFCARRVWSQKLESGLFCKVEHAFHAVVAEVLSGTPVSDHDAVTAYVAIWQQRSRLRENLPHDVSLKSVGPSELKKEHEETLESRGYGFLRGTVVPGRIGAFVSVVRNYHMTMHALGGTRWGVIVAPQGSFFLCPADPQGQLYVPISRRRALVAGWSDQTVPEATVLRLNRDAHRNAMYVFGHPDDIATFADG